MCGVAGLFGPALHECDLPGMLAVQRHRGPDDQGLYLDKQGNAGLGHNRLSIIDLSSAGHQPMPNCDESAWIAFNGEIYNYPELRTELCDYPYRSNSDTEVILAAYQRWGTACLDHLVGMFAFLLWDVRSQRLFAARDRLGVKPLYYHLRADGGLIAASEIKAIHAAGAPRCPDECAWASYLTYGLHDHSDRTFWRGVRSLPPGHMLTWEDGTLRISCWYDLAQRSGPEFDPRPAAEVREEYLALLTESVRLRFRSDVPVGINLSGGLDSSILLGVVHLAQGSDSNVKAFTFATGDPEYDELPWVESMLARTHHTSVVCRLSPDEVPALAESVQQHADEPFGGIPTLAYARLFERARQEGTVVLLDGQGMDEQWAGYDYYAAALNGGSPGVVQGTRQSPVRPDCLAPEFRALAQTITAPQPFPDRLRNTQYRDIRHTKIPRALRFNDRVSMRASTELREPFLDHRLLELALRQTADRKIAGGTHKSLLREIARPLLPGTVAEGPKRALQTPQREWLRGPLSRWCSSQIDRALSGFAAPWLDRTKVSAEWKEYLNGNSDNSFYVWQWVSMGLLAGAKLARNATPLQPNREPVHV